MGFVVAIIYSKWGRNDKKENSSDILRILIRK